MDLKMWTDIILILVIVLNFASVCAIVPLGIYLYRSVLEAKVILNLINARNKQHLFRKTSNWPPNCSSFPLGPFMAPTRHWPTT